MKPVFSHFLSSSFVALAALAAVLPSPAFGVDPLYQEDMQRLLRDMGSLYFLHPLCEPDAINWRNQAAELISLDQPDDDRRQRLNGAFNEGYQAYARLYQNCTASAEQAITRLLVEANDLARDIHSRYAE